MTTMNVSLPGAVREFVEHQVEQGGYATPSEYVRRLVRHAAREKARERLEQLLLDGLNSGPAVRITPQWWAERRAELARRLRERGR